MSKSGKLRDWVFSIGYIAKHHGIAWSENSVPQNISLYNKEQVKEFFATISKNTGLQINTYDASELSLSSWVLPVVVLNREGSVGVITAISNGGEAQVVLSETIITSVAVADLTDNAEMFATLQRPRAVADARIDSYIKPYERGWLRPIVVPDLRPYGHVMVASFIANLLALAGVLFSMQVYDRVIPSQSLPTLYVLFVGVIMAILFDFLLRRLRVTVVDVLGKRADIRVSDHVFGHAIRVKNRATPRATGTFISQLRDLEQIRELLTSTTVSALADVPFFLVFIVVFWMLGGSLVLIPLSAICLIIVPGLIAQPRLRAFASDAMRESSLRNALLVEAVQGIEDIKLLQAENRFQDSWNHYNSITADAQLKLRQIVNTLTAWSQAIQMGVFSTIILMGAPLVISGDFTTGTLIAVSILGSRMMAPIGHITQILNRLQQARIGVSSLDKLMKLPVDQPAAENVVRCPNLIGRYELSSASFRYGDEASPVALTISSLKINDGEKIAVIGKSGAGKSSLLQALSGILDPSSGEVLLDNISLKLISPHDVRQAIGLLTQNARLFHGTIRENVTLGAPFVSDDDLVAVLSTVGAMEFINKLPSGLAYMLQEGGGGLSGGQKQALLLARTLIRYPKVVLLDEPTSFLDETTERLFIEQFKLWSESKTVIVATHRMRILELVDRIIVMENGKIVMDGKKDKILAILRGSNYSQ